MLVDDEPDILLSMRLLLEARGYSVLEATSCDQALEIVERADPDAMMLDLRMPGKDGWVVLEELRRKRQVEHLPVIIVSAHASPGTVKRSLELGARGYVRKPFTGDDLDRALEAVA